MARSWPSWANPALASLACSTRMSHSHRVLGCRLLQASALPYGGAISYLPVIHLLQAYFRIDQRDNIRSIRAKATGHLLTLDETLKDLLPPVLWLLDALPEQDDLWHLEPPQRHQRALDAVRRLLVRESQVQPLVLMFEDLHWIDTETQALLDALVESVPAASILLLVNYRPEYGVRRLVGNAHYRELRIDALPPETAQELLQELIGGDPALVPLKRLLIERTDGNPFFLKEESPHARGDWRARWQSRRLSRGQGSQTLQVPTTVQALLAGRIDRLSPEDKRVLQAASVIGRTCHSLCSRESRTTKQNLHRGLDRLQAAEFLYEARLFPELEYTFKHALTHEVAYASLVHERRQALHRDILETLERRLADHPGEEFERLARHAVGAESWDKAATYLRQAAQRAIGRSSYTAAAGLLREALQVLARLPDTPETLAQSVDARLELRVALIPLGQYQEVLAVMREAEGLATFGDRSRLGRVLADICARLRNVAGEHRQAIEVGRRALAIAGETGDRELEHEAQYRIGQAYFALGDYGPALDMLSRCAEGGREDRLVSPLVASWSHAWLALTLSSVGRFVDARTHAQEALRIAQDAEHPFTPCRGPDECWQCPARAGEPRPRHRGARARSRAHPNVESPILGGAGASRVRLRALRTVARGSRCARGSGAAVHHDELAGRGARHAACWLGQAYLLEVRLDHRSNMRSRPCPWHSGTTSAVTRRGSSACSVRSRTVETLRMSRPRRATTVTH